MRAAALNRFWTFALLLAGVAVSIWGAASPPPRTVSLYLNVTQDDKLVLNLKPQNFRLIEDGQPLRFRLEEPEKPANIVLLVEHSRASWFYGSDIVSAAQAFLNTAPEGHYYALATFAHETTIDQDFTKSRGEVIQAFERLGQQQWNEIDTYDAVYDMLERLSRLPGRRILVFVGSGLDTMSSHTLDDVRRKIESTNVVVYVLGAGSMLRGVYEPDLGTVARMDLLQAEAFLRMLAEKSGGQAWFPRFEQEYSGQARAIGELIESQYRLVYESSVPDDGKFHKIRVEASALADDKRTDYTVRVREGWRF